MLHHATKLKTMIVFLLTFAVAGITYAGNLDQKKQKINGHIDKHISIFESFRSCVQSSNSKEEIKTCRATKKQELKSFRESRKAERAQRKESRKAAKEKRKQTKEK